MSDPNVYQQLGSLQAKVGILEQGQRDMSAKLDTLLERSAKDEATRATLWKAGGVSGGIVGIIIGALQWVAAQWGGR